MPDPVLMLDAAAAAALAAAALLVLLGGAGRSRPALAALGGVLGVGAGYALGAWVLGLRPRWPLAEGAEDKDRFLALVLPATLAVEVVAAFPRVPRWLAWALRLAVAAGAAPALLYGSVYLTDPPGGTREWTTTQAWLILGGLAAALGLAWALLAAPARRPPGRTAPLALALASGAAAATVMLSGSLSEGLLGIPLAGALAGVGVASLLLPGSRAPGGAVGFGVVGLFSLLLAGRLFAELTTVNAVLLFAAPLLCWAPELPYVGRLPAWLRGAVGVSLVLLVAVFVTSQAQQKFVEESRTSPASNEPTLQDYEQFGR
jgi:hypothetical protein